MQFIFSDFIQLETYACISNWFHLSFIPLRFYTEALLTPLKKSQKLRYIEIILEKRNLFCTDIFFHLSCRNISQEDPGVPGEEEKGAIKETLAVSEGPAPPRPARVHRTRCECCTVLDFKWLCSDVWITVRLFVAATLWNTGAIRASSSTCCSSAGGRCVSATRSFQIKTTFFFLNSTHRCFFFVSLVCVCHRDVCLQTKVKVLVAGGPTMRKFTVKTWTSTMTISRGLKVPRF